MNKNIFSGSNNQFNNHYQRRNPNDKSTYVSYEDRMSRLQKKREHVRNMAIHMDTERELSDDWRISGKEKETLAVFSEGGVSEIRDISMYKKPLYLSYDTNNPALVQGSSVVTSMRCTGSLPPLIFPKKHLMILRWTDPSQSGISNESLIKSRKSIYQKKINQ